MYVFVCVCVRHSHLRTGNGRFLKYSIKLTHLHRVQSNDARMLVLPLAEFLRIDTLPLQLEGGREGGRGDGGREGRERGRERKVVCEQRGGEEEGGNGGRERKAMKDGGITL